MDNNGVTEMRSQEMGLFEVSSVVGNDRDIKRWCRPQGRREGRG